MRDLIFRKTRHETRCKDAETKNHTGHTHHCGTLSDRRAERSGAVGIEADILGVESELRRRPGYRPERIDDLRPQKASWKERAGRSEIIRQDRPQTGIPQRLTRTTDEHKQIHSASTGDTSDRPLHGLRFASQTDRDQRIFTCGPRRIDRYGETARDDRS